MTIRIRLATLSVGLALIAEGRNDAKTAAGYYAQALALD